MQITDAHWNQIRRLFSNTFKTSFHYAFATVGEDGSPHVTPIGSLVLGEKGKGYYFEEYPVVMPRNFRKNKRVSVLAVQSSKWLLLKALLFGKFSVPFAVRLNGTVGERREATQRERDVFRQRLKRYHVFRGYNLLWGKLKYVRDVTFDSFEPVHAGIMTQGLWNNKS